MRELLLAGTLLLAACAAAAPGETGAMPGVDSAKTCNASNTSQFVGLAASEETVEAIRTTTGSASVRVVHPDEMVTMEFSASRVTIHVDSANKITRIVCG